MPEPQVTAAFYLIKKGKSAASHRENSHNIFRNRAGLSTMRTRSGQACSELLWRLWTSSAQNLLISLQSVSRTSARQRSCGIKIPAILSATRLSGSVVVLLNSAILWRKKDWQKSSVRKPALYLMLISQEQRSAGFSTTFRKQENVPSAENCSLVQ